MRRRTWMLGVLLAGLWLAPVLAAEDGQSQEAAPQAEEQASAPGAAVEVGKVPQAQIDLFHKREAAKLRRDELLKVREQAVTRDE